MMLNESKQMLPKNLLNRLATIISATSIILSAILTTIKMATRTRKYSSSSSSELKVALPPTRPYNIQILQILFLLIFVSGFVTVNGLKCYMCGQYNEGVGSITPCLNYSEKYQQLYLKDCSKKSEKYCVTGGTIQNTLQEVTLKIYSDEECRIRHENATTVHHLCGGVDEGYKGQCSGDSGGPLIYNDHIQLGIVSWSIKPCTRPPYPGVYTKVSHYVPWIKEHMNE